MIIIITHACLYILGSIYLRANAAPTAPRVHNVIIMYAL